MTSTSAADRTPLDPRRPLTPRRPRTPLRLLRRAVRPLLVVAFWLAVWQVAAVVVDQDILLVTPAAAIGRLGELAVTGDFWATVWHSFSRIGGGFAAATVVGVLGAAAAAGSRVFDALVTPALTAVRTTPVVSFIILVLMWPGSSGRLALIISFLMVLPITYTNVLEGIRSRNRALLEVATVFRVPLLRRIPAIDVPAVLPFLIASCKIGVGLAWKSGIAAEVIGLTDGSIGERLYQAKIFLTTADLFAWTAVIIAVSFTFEKVVVALLQRADQRLSRGRSA